MLEPNCLTSPEASAHIVLDRRAWVRYPCRLATSCFTTIGESHQREPATLRDLSAGGVGLLLAQRPELGAYLDVELPPGPSARSRTMHARVVYTCPHSGGGWVVGCAFAKPLTEGELQMILEGTRRACTTKVGLRARG